ncbi:BrnT family toxin [Leptospira sp. WS58.C1]|uniref:BrnT family toxin n=1 Tax=Leptospira cinconiae TaxID=3235173 RepID=UPI00349E603B
MSSIDFEWDSVKNSSNKRKHGISFEEAKTVFYDENARIIHDPDHSEKEERFIILGFSNKLNLLMVSHCYRSSKDVIRIISARKATKSESKQYEAFL